MKSFLHKLAIFAITALTCAAIQAQEKGDMAAGAHLVLATGNSLGNSYTNFGIGTKFQYNIFKPVRLEGLFSYFPEKDFVSMWDVSANGHYLIPVADQVMVYPLGGMGIFGTKTDHGSKSYSSRDICINLGIGVDYQLNDHLVFYIELKSKIVKDWNRLMLSAGLAYRF